MRRGGLGSPSAPGSGIVSIVAFYVILIIVGVALEGTGGSGI
jgi:hypothetical protein